MAAGRDTAPNRVAALSGADFVASSWPFRFRTIARPIQLFQDEARMGQDPRLRKYATDNLPMLHRNPAEAEAIKPPRG